jgi:hypothetical protein
MTDTHPSGSSVVYGVFDGSRAVSVPLTPADAGASGPLAWPALGGAAPGHALPPPPAPPASAAPPGDGIPKKKGSVLLDADVLRALRESRMLSQQELADLFDLRNIRIAVATIKRAETGHAVRYRIAREFARFFGVPVETLLKR